MSRHYKSARDPDALTPHWIYFVEVCGFTFEFGSLARIEEYLAYYNRKIQPSSADGAHRPSRFYARDNDGNPVGFYSQGDHWERQSNFDRLPLYLREEHKRLKFVKALERALKQWRAQS